MARNGESKPNESEVGRELRSDDNRCALRVQDGVMTYTTSLYEDSPHFLAEWRSMLDCLCAAGGVKVQRLGLRYVDFIIPTAGKVPEDYFKDGFGHLPHVFGEEIARTAFMSHKYPRGAEWGMRVQYWTGLCATFPAAGSLMVRFVASGLVEEIHRRAIGGSGYRPLARGFPPVAGGRNRR